jgi:F0F1-type ATP synthase delta subunit
MHDVLKIIVPIAGAHVVVLVAIVLAVKRVLLGDTRQAVERVRQVEAEVKKKEEAMRRQLAEHDREFEKRKAEAEEALERHKAENQKEAARVRDEMVAEAKRESEEIVERARQAEKRLKEQVVQEMEEKLVAYAGDMLKLIFSERIDAALNTHFVGELLDALEEIEPGTITVETDEAVVISSHPFVADDEKRLEALLREKLDRPITVSQQIDADLLAGIILKIGSLEIDGSLKTRFEEAAAEMKKHVSGSA